VQEAPISADRSSRSGFDPVVPAIGFTLLAGMTWLYATGSELYGRILAYWTFVPWRSPFIDTAVIPGWIRCFREHGLVVYTDAAWAACGLGPIIYSPLWLRLGFVPTDPTWTNWLGLSLVSLFLLSLGLLPAARRPGDRVVVILSTFSCLPVFAMERGNVDLVIFLLAVAAALCMGRVLGRRMFGYALMLLAGLLKFYPLVLLAMLLRERLKALLALGVAAVAITTGSALLLLDELRRLTPVPGGAPFHNLWGARNLTTGFPVLLRGMLDAAGLPDTLAQPRIVSAIVAAMLMASTLLVALRLARGGALRAGLHEIPDRAYQFLLIGGLLVTGCFFAGQSIGYRGVFLLLILPGMLALYHVPSRSRTVYAVTIGAMLCVLWELTVRHVVADIFGGSYYPVEGSAAVYVVWLVQELAWWWLVTVLLAIQFVFVADAPVWRELRQLARTHGMRLAETPPT
jgi:hypothetical protein